MQPLGNITLLERPLRSITLLTVVRAALRARARQYEVEHHIQEMRQAETEKTEAYAREEAAQAQVELLNHVGEILSAELNLDTLLPAIIEAGTDLSGADIGMFFSEGVVEGARKFALRCVSNLTLAGPALCWATMRSWTARNSPGRKCCAVPNVRRFDLRYQRWLDQRSGPEAVARKLHRLARDVAPRRRFWAFSFSDAAAPSRSPIATRASPVAWHPKPPSPSIMPGSLPWPSRKESG